MNNAESPDTFHLPMLRSSRSRRRFVKLLGGLGAAWALPACESLADKPVSIASHVWVGYEPMFLARSEGWLDEKQVRIFETTAATESMRALAEGKVEGAALTLDEVFKARQEGQKLTVVMIYNISAGADMLLARAGIASLADLKGKRIGFEQSSVGELMLSEILRTGNLSRDDLKLLPLSVDKHLEAWNNNQLDAAVTYEPVASELLAQGASKLFDSRQIPNTIIDVLAMRTDVLDSHASAIRQLIQSHFKALDHLTRNPQDAAYRMAGHLKLKAEDVLPAFKGLVLPDAAHNYRLLAGTTPELLATARKLSAVMVKNNLLKENDFLNSLIRADFLPAEARGR
ncbi:MAG: ABC transporter substrate-binding protein [Azonexus sp.]|nr:ABC transporter substrate-binding protein [Azonexus sp.]